jgi:hypothetical protein
MVAPDAHTPALPDDETTHATRRRRFRVAMLLRGDRVLAARGAPPALLAWRVEGVRTKLQSVHRVEEEEEKEEAVELGRLAFACESVVVAETAASRLLWWRVGALAEGARVVRGSEGVERVEVASGGLVAWVAGERVSVGRLVVVEEEKEEEAEARLEPSDAWRDAKPLETRVHALCFSRDAKYLAASLADGSVTAWDVASARRLWTSAHEANPPLRAEDGWFPADNASFSLAATGGGGRLCSVSFLQQRLHVWEWASGALLAATRLEGEESSTLLGVEAEEDELWVARGDAALEAWRLELPRLSRTRRLERIAQPVARQGALLVGRDPSDAEGVELRVVRLSGE